jgi:hypothetical protein
VIQSKDKRYFGVNHIAETQQLREMVENVNILGKNNINRLSDYIVIDNLKIELYRQLTAIELQKQSKALRRVALAMLSWNGEDQYRDICDAILEDKIVFKTNISERYLKDIMPIVKHAFTIYASKELMSHFITINIAKCLNLSGFHKYQCIIELLENTYGQRDMIPWVSEMQYLYAFHTFTQHKRDLIILIYFFPSPDHPLFKPSSSDCKEILNVLNNNNTSSTIVEMKDQIENKIINSNSEYLFLHNHDDNHLKQIRSVIHDQNAFCYVSNNNKKFLICYANLSFNVQCIYAAKIGSFLCAIFTLVTDNAQVSPYRITSVPLLRKLVDHRIIKYNISEPTQDDHENSFVAENVENRFYEHSKVYTTRRSKKKCEERKSQFLKGYRNFESI